MTWLRVAAMVSMAMGCADAGLAPARLTQDKCAPELLYRSVGRVLIGLTMDETHLYAHAFRWSLADPPDLAILGFSKDGAASVLIKDVAASFQLFAGPERLYWADNLGHPIAEKMPIRIWSLLKQGGGPVQSLTELDLGHSIGSMTVTPTRVVWVEYLSSHDWRGELRSMPKDGGPVKVLHSWPAAGGELISRNETLFWTEGGELVQMEPGAAPINRAELVAPGVEYDNVRTIASDGTDVFFADEDHGLGKVDAAGKVMSLGEDHHHKAWTLAIDDQFVYWLVYGTRDGEVLRRVRKDGTHQEVLLTGIGVDTILADEQYLYWTTTKDTGDGNYDGLLMRMNKRCTP